MSATQITTATQGPTSTPPRRLSPRATVELRNILVALLVAVVVCLVMWRRIPKEITDQTDVIGYPVWADFNIHRYFSEFHIVAYWLPGIALAVYLALTALTRRRARRSTPRAERATAPRTELEPITWGAPGVIGRVARTLAVGGVFGLEITVWQNSDHPLRLVAGVAVAWALLVHGVALGWARLRRPASFAAAAGAINAVMAPLGIVGLLLVSNATSVLTEDDGRLHPHPWLPWWVALVFAVIGLAMVVRPLLRVAGRVDPLVIERRAVVYLTIPLAIYVSITFIPGALPSPGWVFEEGHWLAGQNFATHGLFPWRDYLFDHGLFEDTFRGLVGVSAFGGSRWSSAVGDFLIWIPAFVLGLYYLAAYLLESRSVAILLAIAAVLAVNTPFLALHLRFLLWAYILILFLASLRKPVWWRPALMGVLLTAQSVLVPESAYCDIAVLIALVGYEAMHRDGRSWLTSFRRTLWLAGGAAVPALVFLAILVSQHAFGAFVNYYVVFLDSHEIAGGIPHLDWTVWTVFWAASPIAGWLATVAYLTTRVRRRYRLDSVDWTLAAAAILTVLYYGKWLGRADLHIFQSYSVALPMFVLLTYIAMDRLDRGALRLPRIRMVAPHLGGRMASALLAVVVLGVLAQPLADTVKAAPARFHPGVVSEPSFAKLGYAASDSLDPVVYRDLKLVVDTYVRQGGRIQDFSNEPGLWHFLYGLMPATRYYHIALAIPESAQEDAIKQLAANPPTLVVMSNGLYGLPSWDFIANQVRHHTVAQWIYDHYRPLMVVDTHVFFVLASANVPNPSTLTSQLSKPPVTTGVDFTMGCDWGYIPDHLSVVPSADEQAAATTVWSGSGATAGPLTIPVPAGRSWRDFRWLEIDADTGFSADTWALYQGPNDVTHNIVFGTKPVSPHRYFVHVGGCAQWHGYSPTSVILDHNSSANITSIRVLP